MNQWMGDLFEERLSLGSVSVDGVDLKPGDRVRLWPSNRADIFDIALEGQVAVIEAIEHDFDNKVHLAVVLEDDPGRDLGMLRQPGHRFFFGLDEVLPVDVAGRYRRSS